MNNQNHQNIRDLLLRLQDKLSVLQHLGRELLMEGMGREGKIRESPEK